MRAVGVGRIRRGLTIRQLMVAVVVVALACWLVVIFRWGVVAMAILATPPLIVGAVVVLFKRRSTEQDALLWVLTIAAAKRVPLAPGLEAFAGQWGGGYRRRIRALAELLAMGMPLADALERVPGLLRPGTLMMARFGEETGLLVPALEEAARHRRERAPGLSAVVGRIAYLFTVLLVIQGIATFILIFVAPKMRAIFADFGLPLPPLTTAVMASGDLLVSSWLPLALVGFVVLTLAGAVDALVSRSGGGSLIWDRLTRGRQIPEVLRALAVAIEGGRPVLHAFEVLADRHPSAWMRRRMDGVAGAVAAGTDWTEAMRRVGLLRRSDAALLGAAQRVGNLPWALRELAVAGERRLGFRLMAAVQLLFPLAILSIGGVVLVFALAYFGPLVTLLEVLAR